MLEQLPVELLQELQALLVDEDLCTLALVCRYLHRSSLFQLFTRNQIFTSNRSIPRRAPGPIYVPVHSTSGLCITLKAPNNLPVLLGLRVTLPFVSYERPITTVIYCFSDPHEYELLKEELRSLGRFLVHNPRATTVESIFIDLGPTVILESACQWPESDAVLNFLRLINDSRKELRRHSHLMIVGGPFLFAQRIPRKISWLRGGYEGSNTIQTVCRLASKLWLPTPRLSFSKSESSDSGLLALTIDIPIIFRPAFFSYSLDWFAHGLTSLRTLSIPWMNTMWSVFIATMTLPNLEELHFNHCSVSLPLLVNFLVRHRKVKVLDMGLTAYVRQSWSPPLLFLPHLTTIVTSGSLISCLLKPRFGPKPLPNLESLALCVFVNTDTSLLRHLLGHGVRLDGFTIRRMNNVVFGLRISIATYAMGWLKDEAQSSDPDYAEQVTACSKVVFIQIHLYYPDDLLEREEVLAGFPKCLQLFPILESLEIWCSAPMSTKNSTSRQQLANRCKSLNPGLQTFCVDDVHLI